MTAFPAKPFAGSVARVAQVPSALAGFGAIVIVAATNTNAVVARADRPNVRYSITSSLQCAVSWAHVLRPDTQLGRSGTLRPGGTRIVRQSSQRVRVFRVQPSDGPRWLKPRLCAGMLSV